MQKNDDFRFVSLLALDLDNGDFFLPSLPDVVLKIRRLLEEEWNPQVSKSIIESWSFPDNVAESTDPSAYADADQQTPATYADVMFVTKVLIDGDTDNLTQVLEEAASCQKLRADNETAADVMVAYRDKIKSMQQLFS